MSKQHIFRILFHHQGDVYELHARNVQQGQMFAFVEVEDILFDTRSGLLVDPAEERLKSQFAGVTRTLIPIQSVIRIDEVETQGPNKIHPGSGESATVTPFPLVSPPGSKSE